MLKPCLSFVLISLFFSGAAPLAADDPILNPASR